MSANKKAELQAFLDVFPVLADEILGDLRKKNMPDEALQWVKDMLYYNVPGGKLNRGLSVVDTLRILRPDDLTDQDLFNARILGWTVEWVSPLPPNPHPETSASFRLMSPVSRLPSLVPRLPAPSPFPGCRRYHGPITHASRPVLLKHFKDTSYYVDLLELYHEVTFQTELGQLLDLLTAPEDDIDLDRFTPAKHQFIVIFKTAYYSFYLPVALALHMVSPGIHPYVSYLFRRILILPRLPSLLPSSKKAGVKDEKAYTQAREILIPLGEYFQIQDDYLDCYGAPEVIGKIGTDIQDNKCSWLINQAVIRATPEQRKVLDVSVSALSFPVKPFSISVGSLIESHPLSLVPIHLQDNYGKKDAVAEAAIKQTYIELGIEDVYKAYEEKSYTEISALIAKVDESVGIKREVFTTFMNKIYKRTK
ncbi:farnesyl pyrophosphate synthase [Endogone sp. FLAS-F59071]|nr:farnesyl pyrophosphate synthase [Endogone sp. FLAS-F59071]|eukprot:RUS16961.1 farnesyl pyrophosphate synthase [Endogone sp. FLAS-F59071]